MRLYFLIILFFISSLGFAQKYLADLPEADRICPEQNHLLELVIKAESMGLIKQVKNNDGTINHIELTNHSTYKIMEQARKIKNRRLFLALGYTGSLAAAAVGSVFIENLALRTGVVLVSGGLAAGFVVLLVLTPESVGGNSSYLEGITENPITILNEAPVAACYSINSTYPEKTPGTDVKEAVSNLMDGLNLLISFDANS